jgi:hypothetical protein
MPYHGIRNSKIKPLDSPTSEEFKQCIEAHLALSRELLELAQELSDAAAEISRMLHHSSISAPTRD